jgi:hypothetical protein
MTCAPGLSPFSKCRESPSNSLTTGALVNISERSFIYRFQHDSLASDSPRYIPDNLCPYMRRFLRLLLGSVLIYTILTLATACVIGVPIMWIMSLPFDDFIIIYVFGGALWIVGVSVLINRWYVKYGKHSQKLIKAQDKTKELARKIWKPIGSRIDCNIFVQYYRAVHDKICPSLYFYDD